MRAGVLAGLATAMVAGATLIQMWIDWNQMPRTAQLDVKLKIAIAAAGLLTIVAMVLGLLAGRRRR